MDLDQMFQQQFNLRADPPAGAPVTAEPSAAQLREIEAQAEAHAGKTPTSFLTDEQRGAFAQKRSPQLGEILHQCAIALGSAPDFAQTIPVTAQVCGNIVEVDDAITQLVKATGDVYGAATQGVLRCAAEAEDLGTRVLQAVAEQAPGNYQLVLQFASALSLYEASAKKKQAARSKAEAAVAPSRAETETSARQAEEARALADFHRTNRR